MNSRLTSALPPCPSLYVGHLGYMSRCEERYVSPLKDIHGIIIARCDFHAEPRLHMHHALAFISAMH